MPAVADSAAPATLARRIGRYRVLREIGRGSTGVVHLAVDPSIPRHVALKTLALGAEFRGGDFAEARDRLRAEAEASRRLDHPDIAAVIDAGEHDGTVWLAMELLSGCELNRYTRPPRLLPETVVLEIVERLARALAHAHERGVVHRDIKPGNVVVDLPRGTVKLTDFGVAGLADLGRTRTGVVLGTPAYMAPEQLAGGAADGRGDLYSLGVLLFHLLAGRLPHEHGSLGELLRRVAREPAPDLCTLRPELPPALAAVAARALQPQPGGRFATGTEMADALAAARSACSPPAGHTPRIVAP